MHGLYADQFGRVCCNNSEDCNVGTNAGNVTGRISRAIGGEKFPVEDWGSFASDWHSCPVSVGERERDARSFCADQGTQWDKMRVPWGTLV